MWPAYPAYFVLAYFLLALLIPICWALGQAWRHARIARQLSCPSFGSTAVVALDPWFAVRRHASGAEDFRVLQCSRWPEHRNCAQECLSQVAPRR